MTFRKIILATAVLATATGYAFAQTPTERTGSKTDINPTAKSQEVEKQDMQKSGTTGSGMTGTGMSGSTGSGATSDKANGQMLNKNVSPASEDSGLKQQK